MSAFGEAVARAACELVGTPFRLHGRNPVYGLDCIGLVAVAIEKAGGRPSPPTHYRLRNSAIVAHLRFANQSGLVETIGRPRPGDVLLVAPGPAQHHLLVAAGACRFVHAHAGLRRVSVIDGPIPWPVLRHWRPTRPEGA